MNRKLSKLNAWTRITSLDFDESMSSGPFKGMSPLRTMLLTTSYGCEMLIEASGPDADEALDEMQYALLCEHFDKDGNPVPNGGKRHRNKALEARMFARDREWGKIW